MYASSHSQAVRTNEMKSSETPTIGTLPRQKVVMSAGRVDLTRVVAGIAVEPDHRRRFYRETRNRPSVTGWDAKWCHAVHTRGIVVGNSHHNSALCDPCSAPRWLSPYSLSRKRRPTIELIRAARDRSNAAIAKHDLEGIAAAWMDDVHVVSSTSAQAAGKSANRERMAAQFKNRPDTIYVRNPITIEVYAPWNVASERGEWTGKWSEPDGALEIGGTYQAQWRKIGGRWLIQAELFVPTHCKAANTAISDLEHRGRCANASERPPGRREEAEVIEPPRQERRGGSQSGAAPERAAHHLPQRIVVRREIFNSRNHIQTRRYRLHIAVGNFA